METTLHRELKERYCSRLGGRSEVTFEGFRIDAVDETGLLIEIQSGALSPLRAKLQKLLPRHRVKVVKPIVLERRVVRRTRLDGPDLSARRSPSRGAIFDAFEHLVGLARLFPNPHLTIEILGVTIDEIRVPRRRWPGFKVIDRRLDKVQSDCLLRDPSDLWGLLPRCDWHEPFTTADIAARAAKPLWLAQRAAYCLRLSGAAGVVGKRHSHWLYARPLESTGPSLPCPVADLDPGATSPAQRRRRKARELTST